MKSVILEHHSESTDLNVYQQKPNVTYAISSVMWFSGIFKQFPYQALMVSEL